MGNKRRGLIFSIVAAVLLVSACGLFFIPRTRTTNDSQIADAAAGDTGHTLVEYIDCPYGSYFNTGYKPTSKMRIKVDMQITANTAHYLVFGSYYHYAYSDGTANDDECYYDYSTKGRVCFPADSAGLTNIGNGSRFVVDWDSVTKVNRIVVGNTEYIGNYGMRFKNNGTEPNVYLLGLNRDSVGISGHAPTRLYMSQIWDDGVLIRDFVPVKRNSDGQAGLYDRVEDKFYSNSGSGTISAGDGTTVFVGELYDHPENMQTLYNYVSGKNATYADIDALATQKLTSANLLAKVVGEVDALSI